MSLENDLEASVEMIERSRAGAPVNNAAPLARTQPTTVVVQQPPPALEFTPEQQQMIRDTYANGASASEFQWLLEIAKARRLNPFLRQIHFVDRWDKKKGRRVWSAQVSIDGLRAIAERTGRYDGQDEPVFEYEKETLRKCTVKVYRKDWSRPAVGVAFFDEYAQGSQDGLTSFWRDKPHVMLAKCAEALAMRKAFPEDTSGLYIPEELGDEPLPLAERRANISPHQIEGDDPERTPDEAEEQELASLLGRLRRLEAQACATGVTPAIRAEFDGICKTIADYSGIASTGTPFFSQEQRKAAASAIHRVKRVIDGTKAPPPPEKPDNEIYESIMGDLVKIYTACERAQPHELKALRLTLGAQSAPSELMNRITAAKPKLDKRQRMAIGRLWSKADNELRGHELRARTVKATGPDVLESFIDSEDEETEADPDNDGR